MSKKYFECREITQKDELEAIYKLRYKVYVEEMEYINYENKEYIFGEKVIDKLDSTAHHFAVFHNNTIIAAARYNLNSNHEALEWFPEFGETYLKKMLCTSINLNIIEPSRIVISSDYRYTYANLLMFYEMIEHAVEMYGLDAIITKIRKGPLYNFYRHYGFTLLQQYEKNLDIYNAHKKIQYCFAYILMNKQGFDATEKMVTKLLCLYDTRYAERINNLTKKIEKRRTLYEEC